MAVLPEETGAPCDHILDLDEIQTESQTAGMALTINANDRFNRSGRPIAWLRIVCYAILNTDKVRQEITLERGHGKNLTSIEIPLIFSDDT